MKFKASILALTLVLALPQVSFSLDANKEKSLTYRLAIPQATDTFDPLYSDNATTASLIRNLYSTLVTYRTEKNKEKQSYGDIVPSLAEEWNISSDRKVYNFKLKKNIYFHNGRKMTAFDIKHTFERLANPKVLPTSFNWIFKDIPIKGLEKYKNDCLMNKNEPDLVGIRVLDDNIVQFMLDKSTPLFLKELALPIFSITPKEEVDKWGADYKFHPVGTGPYKLESNDQDEIVLQRNENYFEENSKIKTLVYKVVTKSDEEYQMFERGKLDQTSISDTAIDNLLVQENWNKYSINVFDNVSFNNREVSDIIKEPKLVNTFLGINTRRKEFSTAKARQALNYAVNKTRIISNVLKYNAIESVGVLPVNFPGSFPRTVPYSYDPIKSKKLFYEVGFVDSNNDGILEYNKKPVVINFHYYEDPEATKVCSSIADNFMAIGFKVNLVKETNWSDFLKKVISGKADLYHFKANARYPDPDKFYSPMFDSKNIGKTNLSNYSNQNVDKMLARARVIPEDEFRYKVYKEVEKTIVESAPWVFLYQPVKYVKVKPYVYGFKIHPVLQDITKYTYFQKPENLSLNQK